MKKIFLFIVTAAFFQMLSAQYCGNSGPSICSTPANLTASGIAPPYQQNAPFINGAYGSLPLSFKNYDTMEFSNHRYTVQTLKFDSIENLPAGLCWATNKSDNTFQNQENGCILISGTTCALPGQYRLRFTVDVNVGVTLTMSGDVAGLYYYLRVNNNGEATLAIDTNGQQTGTNTFIAYGPAANCQAGPPVVSLGNNQNVCNNSVVVLNPVITGGTPPFTYSWQQTGNALSCNSCSNPTVTITQNSSYTVAVTDAHNYVTVATVNYTVTGSNNLIQLTTANTNINCNAIDTTTLHISNSSLPLALNWGDGILQTGINSVTPAHPYSLSGIYPIIITDANGCVSSVFDTVLNNGVIVSLVNAVRPNCWGMATGSLQISATGGSAPYTYLWSNAATGSALSSIVAANYSVAVTDVNGCSSIFHQYLSSLSSPWGYYTYLSAADANCTTNGSVTVAVYGGVPPYSYLWSNGSTEQNLSGLSFGTYNLTISDSAGCNITGGARVNSSCNTNITGIAFIDSNHNCIFDAGDALLTYMYVSARSASGVYYYGTTNNLGNYSIAVTDTGAFTLSAGYNTGNCGIVTFCNNSQSINVHSLNDTISNINIAYEGFSSFNLGIHPGWSNANPGFTKDYWVYYYNSSPLPFTNSAIITFVYDSNLVYQYTGGTPAPVNDVATHTLQWTVSSVPQFWGAPLQCSFMVPASLSLSTQLQSDFSISPTAGDCDSSDNHYHFSEPVTGSHDPNEKTVEPAGSIMASDSILTYTIHFQNTGTDSTHFVIIKDTLSPNLDPATVRNIASSDKYSSFNLSGKGILTWTFNPLRIVDSATNPGGSKRFITFSVHKKGNLPLGSTISNVASIYFDYNDAVVTNTVADTEAIATYIFEISNNNNISVKAFPNPFSDVTNIVVTGLNEKFGFELYDITGRIQQNIPTVEGSQFQVHKGQLAKGVYLYRLIVANKPAAYGKLVVE